MREIITGVAAVAMIAVTGATVAYTAHQAYPRTDRYATCAAEDGGPVLPCVWDDGTGDRLVYAECPEPLSGRYCVTQVAD